MHVKIHGSGRQIKPSYIINHNKWKIITGNLKMNRTLCLIFISLIICQSNTIGNEKKQIKNNLKGEIALDFKELEKKVLAGDMDALDIVDSMDDKSKVVGLLENMSNEKNPEARIVAVNCLTLINTKITIKVLAKFLKDTEAEVSTSALQAISVEEDKSLLKSVSPQLVENLNHDNPDIREGIAYLIGKIEDQKLMEPLYKRLEVEEDKDVERNIKLALAKLGDNELKESFSIYAKKNDISICIRTLEDMKYINDKNLIQKLLPAIDDLREGYNIGTKDDPEFARLCDAAINLIAEWYDNPFSFEINRYKIYSKEEIEEAKKFLQSLQNK